MIGQRETWKDAFKLISKHMLDGSGRLVRPELVEWHNAANGDDGYRSWWTSIALYQLAFDQASLIPDANRAMYGEHILQYRGDLQRAVSVVSKTCNGSAKDRGVYIKKHGSGTLWGGPYRVPIDISEWPSPIFDCIEYRNEIEFVYGGLDNKIYWFPHTLLRSINSILSDVRPVGVSFDDIDEVSKRYIQNGITSFANGEAPHLWDAFRY
ncbi:hypothetical protein KBD69_03585 [Candidatus Woesebacteria bacterium]|nr:hypothetical protein [Candidatus Woesebacteria bacterium]